MHPFLSELQFPVYDWLIISLKDSFIVIRLARAPLYFRTLICELFYEIIKSYRYVDKLFYYYYYYYYADKVKVSTNVSIYFCS